MPKPVRSGITGLSGPPTPISPSMQESSTALAALNLAARNAQLSTKLAGRFDALNDALATAELQLKKFKLISPVWVYYNLISVDGHDTPPYSFDVIGMTKINNAWRLAHGYDDDRNEGDPWDVQALVDCPIEVRIRAVKLLPKLQEKIVESKEKMIPEVEEAISFVLDFCKGGVA